MSLVAMKMLTGDRAKYLALVFAIACSSFLIAQQSSIFAGLMNRTRSQILDVADVAVWVMNPATEYVDEIYALSDNDLSRVRGVPGVRWAVPFFKGLPRAKAPDGRFHVVILLGLDDASLVGVPRKMLLGSTERLREPDAAIIDAAGFRRLFPGQPLTLNRTLELNDHSARIVGICDASPPFTTFPVMYTRYSQALQYVGRERNLLSFVLVKPQPDVAIPELTRRIAATTGLKAVSAHDFGWMRPPFSSRSPRCLASFLRSARRADGAAHLPPGAPKVLRYRRDRGRRRARLRARTAGVRACLNLRDVNAAGATRQLQP